MPFVSTARRLCTRPVMVSQLAWLAPLSLYRPIFPAVYPSLSSAFLSVPTKSHFSAPLCTTSAPLAPLCNLAQAHLSSSSSLPQTSQHASNLATQSVPLHLLSPMMQHYVVTKRNLSKTLSVSPSSPRKLVQMYRVGDFFESFFEDASLLSSVCQIALTSKDAGKALGTRVPMAGVPHYAIDDKIKMLLSQNITVAVVDQVQSAVDVPAGKLVKRAVTRLITPGTANDDALLEATESRYIAALVVKSPIRRKGGPWEDADIQFGFAYADVSTGEFMVTDGEGLDAVRRLLANVEPAEILLVLPKDDKFLGERLLEEVGVLGTGVISQKDALGVTVAEDVLARFHAVESVESLGCRGRPLCSEAAASLVQFTSHTLAVESDDELPPPLNMLQTFSMSDVMLLDETCLRNMEVIETVRDGTREGSLQWAVDRTVTVLGARCLRAWLSAPSMSLDTISMRHDVVDALTNDTQNRRAQIQMALRNIADIERIAGRVGAHRATPRELRWLCETILQLPTVLHSLNCSLVDFERTHSLSKRTSHFVSGVDEGLIRLAKDVDRALVDPAPAFITSEMFIRTGALTKENWDVSTTRIFRTGYCAELDKLRTAVEGPDQWITALEEQERQRADIDKIRIKHIKNTGFVLRVPRSIGEKKMDEDPMFFVKLGYERAQSTKAELRFRTDQLREHERDHNSAFSEILLLELRLFSDLQNQATQYVPHMRDVAKRIAAIDVLAGFAQVAEEQQYVRPTMRERSERISNIEDARHPVVEQTLPISRTFVPNSFRLGAGKNREIPDLMILCGPNAAGKSCSLRSVGLMCILAQAGSFVPARSAELSLCDRIFTRVGAVDDVARGQSTFQVEMAETACILSHATSSSLVLLDEIGRGTSTVDGIAIAWSVAEHLTRRRTKDGKEIQPPRAMFATHYHELNQLASVHDNVQSFRLHMEKRERQREGGKSEIEWISTHKVLPGASFESLGLTIAKRAGFPREVIERAEQIAKFLKAPSEALCAELKQALSEACGEKRMEREQKEYEAEMQLPTESSEETTAFQAGFEKGYEVAKAELLSGVQSVLAKFQPTPSSPP